jgi:hypothetical protein
MPRKKKRPRTLRRPELTERRILELADAHHAWTGMWPIRTSGRVRGELRDSWLAIDSALRTGLRGLPGGSSLACLLAKKRGVRNRKALPPLTEDQIVRWAEAHHRCTGRWPTRDAGHIHGAPGEVWGNVAAALAQGLRTLPGGDTLARLLERRLGVPNSAGRPRSPRTKSSSGPTTFMNAPAPGPVPTPDGLTRRPPPTKPGEGSTTRCGTDSAACPAGRRWRPRSTTGAALGIGGGRLG